MLKLALLLIFRNVLVHNLFKISCEKSQTPLPTRVDRGVRDACSVQHAAV